MSTYLLSKIRIGALAFPGLTALLGGDTQNGFRWYENQLKQGAQFPAVVVTLVSDPRDYVFLARMATSFARVQFEVWGYDPVQNDAVVQALAQFLDQFNAYGIPGLPQNANFILNDRATMYAMTQPPQYQRVIDAKIFNNEATA